MKKQILFSLLFLVSLLPVLSSCSDDDNDALPSNTQFEMVTYVEQSSEGAVFSLIRKQGDPEIKLIAYKQQVNTSLFPVGCRMIIAYTKDGNNDRSGYIKLYGGAPVINGEATPKTSEETKNFASDKIRLTSVRLTGEYLNFKMKLDCTTKPAYVDLVIDEATLDSDEPVLYLLVKADDLGSAYWQQFYASFKLDKLIESGATHFSVIIQEQTMVGDVIKEQFLL